MVQQISKLEPKAVAPMTASILIADDNEDLRKVLAWLLQPRGYDILQAATGSEAIETAIARNLTLSCWMFISPI